MNRKLIAIIYAFLCPLLLISQNDNHSKVPKTLKGSKWTSQFYYYCNFYHFKTDSNGVFESGQLARSCPIDTLALGISGDTYIYDSPKEFKYKINDTVLIMEYTLQKKSNEAHIMKFYYRPQYKDWISEDEYTYGKECLKMGERKNEL